MARPSTPKDREALRPIIESMIFAAEEPLSPRVLLSLLYEDPAQARALPATPLFDEGAAEENAVAVAADTGSGESSAEPADAPVDAAIDAAVEGEGEGTDGEEETAESLFAPAPERGEREVKGGISVKELKSLVGELNEEYERTGRSFRIIEIAGGFQFATTREFGEFVGLLSRERARRKLSPASLETLSIVAYRQPVTKPEVEAIRGVNCDQVLLSLLERNLIAITGRGDSVGRPLLYGTTAEFLRAFGLNSLDDMPKLRELEELMEEDAHMATPPEVIPAEVTQELLELDDEGNERVESDALTELESDDLSAERSDEEVGDTDDRDDAIATDRDVEEREAAVASIDDQDVDEGSPDPMSVERQEMSDADDAEEAEVSDEERGG